MATNKQELIDHLYNGLQKVVLPVSTDTDRTIPIVEALNPLQIYQILLHVVDLIPKTDFDLVIEANNTIHLAKEETHIVEDFKYKEVNFKILLREIMLLGKGLGYNNNELYAMFIDVFNTAKLEDSSPTITKVAKSLSEVLFATYSAFNTFNLTLIQKELVKAIHKGHMDKLIKNDAAGYVTTLSDTVKQYKEIGREVVSVDLKNGYIAVKDIVTQEVLKPVGYVNPDIEEIIIKHLNKR